MPCMRLSGLTGIGTYDDVSNLIWGQLPDSRPTGRNADDQAITLNFKDNCLTIMLRFRWSWETNTNAQPAFALTLQFIRWSLEPEATTACILRSSTSAILVL